MRADFNRHLVRDGTVAGYALFDAGLAEPELLLHPSDTRTGLRYSLLPMTRSIIGGLFTEEQARHHLRLIREHLLFPDGVRLMDRPVAYHGGPERVFRRAESAAFFGREIGLMYVHAHLRYGEAMAVLGEAEALWEALQVVNPVSVAERVANASPRQRNAYFSSSDAAFRRPLPGERRVGAACGRARSPPTAGGASIPAGRASTPTCCSAMPSASAGASGSALSRRCCREASGGSRWRGSSTDGRSGGICRPADRRQWFTAICSMHDPCTSHAQCMHQAKRSGLDR